MRSTSVTCPLSLPAATREPLSDTACLNSLRPTTNISTGLLGLLASQIFITPSLLELMRMPLSRPQLRLARLYL